jgi:hypothetical protein
MLFVFEAIEQLKAVTIVEFLGYSSLAMYLECKQIDMLARRLIYSYLQRVLFCLPNQVLHDLVRISPIRIRRKTAIALVQA